MLTVYILQNYLLLTYDHNTIYKWISKNFPKDHRLISSDNFDSERSEVPNSIFTKPSIIEKLIGNLCISGWVDFQHILATIRFHEQTSSIGFNRFRIILDQDQNKRGEKII